MMLFGAMVTPRVSDWMLIKDIENMGFDSVWMPDSHMIYSDTYAVLSLAAVNTSKIKLGTGIAVAPTRIAPVTAHSIATINQLAPGRTFLGIGTGHTGMRVMGMDPIKIGEFREYLRVTRALLHGEEIDYTLNGETRDIKFLLPDDGFINVESPVPIYVAADGPLALQAAGIYGDGRICSHNQSKALLKNSLETIKLGAKKAQRVLPETFNTTVMMLKLNKNMPIFAMEKEGIIEKIFDRVIAFAGHKDIDFEMYPNFSKKFLVSGNDEQKIRSFFNDGLIDFFENKQIYHLESNGEALIIFDKIKLARTDETIALINYSKELAKLLI